MMRTGLGALLILAVLPSAGAEDEPGAAVYQRWCVHCHGTQPAAPGRIKLAWTRGVERSILTERDDLDVDYVRQVVRRGQLEMPAFRPTEITGTELDALAAWLGRQDGTRSITR